MISIKTRQKRFLVAFIALVVVAAILIALHLFGTQKPVVHLYKAFTVSNRTFNITALATNQSQWERGLMNTTITNSTLMLFEFNHTADYPFWMFDTYASLDMIWVNYSYIKNLGTVVYVASNATSCFVATKCTVYDPHALANFVIEAKAGFAATNKIGVGSGVLFR